MILKPRIPLRPTDVHEALSDLPLQLPPNTPRRPRATETQLYDVFTSQVDRLNPLEGDPALLRPHSYDDAYYDRPSVKGVNYLANKKSLAGGQTDIILRSLLTFQREKRWQYSPDVYESINSRSLEIKLPINILSIHILGTFTLEAVESYRCYYDGKMLPKSLHPMYSKRLEAFLSLDSIKAQPIREARDKKQAFRIGIDILESAQPSDFQS